MKATTIKIENPLLHEIVNFKPKTLSISAFIRKILEKEMKRQQLTKAANEYAIWLQDNSEEQKWLNQWEEADLTTPPQQTQRSKKK